MRKEDYDVWMTKFEPTLDKDGSPIMYETYGEDMAYITSVADSTHNLLWTLLDSDGKLYLSPGFHYVNRLNYFVCKNTWKDGQRDYKY